MSDYTGPGVYELIPGNAPSRRVSVWAEGMKSGTEVKLYSAVKGLNQLWEIVAAGGDAGNPEVGDRQYHIIGVQSGMMLCAAEDGADTGITISTRNARHGSSRWKMVPAGNGSFFFASVLNPAKYLAISGASDSDGAVVMTYARQTEPHFQFKLKRPSF